ncbi:MAG: SPOR domain-containing protein [Balneolaceae bacterium]|nr:SPOR domain-containing protein [Balneolaceae bacterium]
MTIDREQLIQLLVSKTGFEREKVETQLSELINRIQKAAREGKSFEIEGFGTFSLDEDELKFEPADELETEVNHKYAGMEPIELIGAYDDDDDDEEMEKEEISDEADAGDEEAVEETAAGEDHHEEPEQPLRSEPAAAGGDREGPKEETDSDDDVWGLDEPSGLSDEISKARTEEEAAPEAEMNADEPEEEPSETTEQDLDEVLASLDDDSVMDDSGGRDTDDQPNELDDLERMLSGDTDDEGQEEAAAEAGSTGKKKGRWEPDAELMSSADSGPEPEPKPDMGSVPKTKTQSDPGYKKKVKEEKRDPIGTLLVVFLVLIVVAVGGWFAYDAGVFDGLFTSSPSGERIASAPGPQATVTEQQQNAASRQNQAGGSGTTERQPQAEPESQSQQQQQEQQAVAAGGETEPQPQADQGSEPGEGSGGSTGDADTGSGQPLYGLKGAVNPQANSGYTIVVYSLQNEARARQLRDDLIEDGYRAVLTRAVVSGNDYWRVGLGQFESVGSAQSAARDLREPFRNNFFIKRIE